MIDTISFYNYLKKKKLDFFVGVPDSLLKSLCACIKDNSSKQNNITSANEGNAVGLATGYYLGMKRPAVVYMQNSGIGNTINPLLSIVDKEVYKIPMLLIVGWRGEPNVHDEPQHIKQGKVTLSLFETMGIKTMILDESYQEQIDYCVNYMEKEEQPIALIVKKDTFNKYELINKSNNNYTLKREEVLETIIKSLNSNDFVVSTTGKTSREIFEIRERLNLGHNNDFLTVGGMGHTSSIALGLSLTINENVYCIDGDGSFLMHMGSHAINSEYANNNFKYILINNGAHESVGNQETVAFNINIKKILEACNFKVLEVKDKNELEENIEKIKNSKQLTALIIYTKTGSRSDLGRPTISPVDNKNNLMNHISKIKKEG